MNFEKAILAHKKWKDSLRDSITNGRPLNANDAGDDRKCDLGKWIHGEGHKYDKLAEFQALREFHARFHQCAGAVIRKSAGLPAEEAMKMIAMGSEFSTATSNCIQAMKKLSLSPAYRG